MGDWTLDTICKDRNSEEVMDLMIRAADYVVLETGKQPDARFLRDFFEDAPPGHSASHVLSWGIRINGTLAGIVGALPGYETETDWWIGLLMLDPAYRGKHIGTGVVRELARRALLAGADTLKIAVLCANPAGMSFWRAQGFTNHRDAKAKPGGDGHDRLVLKRRIGGE